MTKEKPPSIAQQFKALNCIEDLYELTFATGKHAGESYLRIRETNPGYLVYLAGQGEKSLEKQAVQGVKNPVYPYPFLRDDFHMFAKDGYTELKNFHIDKAKEFEELIKEIR